MEQMSDCEMDTTAFWETKTLDQITDEEWESLCDGCGQCCLHKLIDEDTQQLFYTRVGCRLLDPDTIQCTSYDNRFKEVEDCLDVRQMSSSEIRWMPKTCAYRLLDEGKPLPAWHPLLTGDPTSPRTARVSIMGRMTPEQSADLCDLESQIIRWIES